MSYILDYVTRIWPRRGPRPAIPPDSRAGMANLGALLPCNQRRRLFVPSDGMGRLRADPASYQANQRHVPLWRCSAPRALRPGVDHA